MRQSGGSLAGVRRPRKIGSAGGQIMSTTTNLEHVAQLAEQLSPEDQLRLVERLAQHLRRHSAPPAARQQPQSLRGVWREHFPDDPNLDDLLYDIRHEWEEEWPETFKK
jgi:hypothetical protein